MDAPAGGPADARGGTAEEADGTAGMPARAGAGGGASGAGAGGDREGNAVRTVGVSPEGSGGDEGAAAGAVAAGTWLAAAPAGGAAGGAKDTGARATEPGATGGRTTRWGATGTRFGAGAGAGRDGSASSACRSTVTWARAGSGASNQAARAAGSRRIAPRPRRRGTAGRALDCPAGHPSGANLTARLDPMRRSWFPTVPVLARRTRRSAFCPIGAACAQDPPRLPSGHACPRADAMLRQALRRQAAAAQFAASASVRFAA